jgi:hypothetical protein
LVYKRAKRLFKLILKLSDLILFYKKEEISKLVAENWGGS